VNVQLFDQTIDEFGVMEGMDRLLAVWTLLRVRQVFLNAVPAKYVTISTLHVHRLAAYELTNGAEISVCLILIQKHRLVVFSQRSPDHVVHR